jgi:hypothetical protein
MGCHRRIGSMPDHVLKSVGAASLLIPGEHAGAIHHCQLDWPEGGRVLLSSTGERPTLLSSGYELAACRDGGSVRSDGTGPRAGRRGRARADRPDGLRITRLTVADSDGNHWTFATFAG